MSSTPHPRAQLSAYLDDALGSDERRSIEAHLDACADCQARLSELRATASLIRGLPDVRPSRRLAPRIVAVPAWLAPLRTLSTIASGVSVFLFLATAVLSQMGQFTATSGAAPAAAPAPGGATSASGAPFADNASRSVSGASGSAAAAPSGPPQAALSTTRSPADAAKQAGPTASASAEFSVSSGSPQVAADTAVAEHTVRASTSFYGSPLFWLALAVITGALAFALQRRLRSA